MYPVTTRTTPHRLAERVSYDRAAAHAILDEAYVCHLGFTAPDGPRVLPTLVARIGDTLYVHGSTGSGPLLALRQGGPVCLTVTLLDGLVLARSQFHHSANYRSVVVYGTATVVIDEAERRRAMDALVDKVAPGRSAQTRPPNARELAATAILAIPLAEVSVKARRAGVAADTEDYALPYWAGVVPLRLTRGVPEPDAGVGVPVPAALRPHRSPWLEPAVLRGRYVVLEPLDVCHAAELFAALDDEEVHRYIPRARPTSAGETADTIAAMLHEHAAGLRVPWVQRDTATGAVVGTTSYCPPDERNRSVHIGSTQVGRKWWRTGINTEAKLLLMTRAFDELGAVRVEWQTDALNLRSQAAVERLGATKEGVLRRHKLRGDGTWRDSVFYGMTDAEWPAAKARLTDRLGRGGTRS
ncbi:MAG: GNAT family N-acetyltransferase [Actinobacteria bacterium 13_1_20CM_3_71_11]|nr:MAG: GNAT family N-acetyltransferase [Actinobacteria bacterium 13_1_20CM_3_71_11]